MTPMMAITHCPEHMLGNLSPDPENLAVAEWARGHAEVNGVILPDHVIEELRREGIPVSWYTRGELEAARIACAVDRELIDDPAGGNFFDRLHLTDEEKRARAKKVFRHGFTHSFCDRLRCEEESEEEQAGLCLA